MPSSGSFSEDAVRFFHELVHAPEYHRLRWVLLIGTLIELILAPLTSWAFDTPGFVETSNLLLTTGNPYGTGLWFNPPLGPYLDVPFMAIWNWLSGGASVVTLVPALQPAASATGLSTYVPLPGPLLAWKLPLIIANLVTALALVSLLGHYPTVSRRPEWIAAAWLFNPLVIYVSAVHGEVDALAAALVLLTFVALYREAWLTAGLLLGLAVMTKGYPLALIPPITAYLLMAPLPSLAAVRGRIEALGRAAIGIGVAALIFLPDLGYLYDALFVKYTDLIYGALSVEVIFNPAVPKGTGPYHAFTTNTGNAFLILEGFRVLGLLAILGGTLLLAYRLRSAPHTPRATGIAWLAVASNWAVLGLLLMDPSPEAENLVDVLSLTFLVLPLVASDRRLIALVAALSLAGVLQYWSLATPFGYFPPLAMLLGPGAVSWLSATVTGFASGGVRGVLWLVVGLFGGSVLLILWGFLGWISLPEPWRVRLRARLRRPGRGSDA